MPICAYILNQKIAYNIQKTAKVEIKKSTLFSTDNSNPRSRQLNDFRLLGGFWLRDLREEGHFEDLGVDERIIF